jgi:hypothetical protein
MRDPHVSESGRESGNRNGPTRGNLAHTVEGGEYVARELNEVFFFSIFCFSSFLF